MAINWDEVRKKAQARGQKNEAQMAKIISTPSLPKAPPKQPVKEVKPPAPSIPTRTVNTPRGQRILPTNDRQRYIDTTRQGTAQAIQDNAGARAFHGFQDAWTPLNIRDDFAKQYGQETVDTLEKSKAFRVGQGLGVMAQFALPYAGAAPKIGSALTKLPKYAKMGKLGQGIARSVATDLAVGVPLNVNYALNKEGLRGEDALKNIGVNTAIDLVAGGILETIPVILKSGKKVASKVDFDNLPASEKAEVMTELERLAYESNVRKGKITPQGDTLYGNAPRPIAGELPAPRMQESVPQFDIYATAKGQREVPRTITPGELSRATQPEIPVQGLNRPVDARNIESGVNVPKEQTFAKNGLKSVGADTYKGEKTVDQLVDEFGSIKKGEPPRAREVDIPKKTDYGDVQQHARTLQESAIVDDTLFKDINDAISQGSFTKATKGNKTAVENANYTLDKDGLNVAMDKFKSVLKSDKKVTSEDIALGNRVLQELQKNGRYNDALDVATDLSEMLSETGRTLQAARIAKRLSPEGRLMAATRAAERISKKSGKKIKLSDEAVERISKAKTEKEIVDANEKAGIEIWNQVPANWIAKVNSWRYISMLMNPKTHMRNIVGNALFLPAREFKNLIGTGLEKAMLPRAGEKTKAILNPIKDSDLLKFASKDFDNVKSIMKGEGKIDDSFRKLDAQVFKTKWLEWTRKMNLNALDAEDTWFMKFAYDSSMAQYMKANNIVPEKMVGEVLEKGRKYAMDEALKATYRDFNALANLISRAKAVGSSGKYGWMGQAGATALEGVIPFAKTPMNLVKRGIGYSPANIVRGLVNLKKVKAGKVTATEAIDQLASGLAGTAILGLGTLLGYYNIVTGKEGEYKDKLYNYNQMLGSQNYSLVVNGTSFTLDWAAPMSMPFFTGVELSKAIKDNGGNLANVIDSYTKISDPMINMSMLRGINDILTNNYEGLGQTTMDIGMGYAGQFNPTVFGQIARTVDGTRRSTISTAETGIGKTLEKFGRKQVAKLPMASKKLEPYVDMWGREQETGNVIENFLSPGYFKSENMTPVDTELRSLIGKLDEETAKKIIPASSAYQYTLEAVGETYRMTEKESTAYQKIRGQESYRGLQKLFGSSKYKTMTKDEKVKAIEDTYNNAKEKAKYNFLVGRKLPVTLALGAEQHAKYQSVKNTGISDRQYYTTRKKIGELETVNQESVLSVLDNMGMNQKQKEAMWYVINSGWTEASNPYKDPTTDYKFNLMSDTKQEKFTYVSDSGISQQQYANVLGRADTNGNGSITKAELKTAMLNEGLSSQQRHEMYKIVNSNWKGE